MAINRQKISQMTPKGSDLSATDLLEVSVDTGSGYETRSITGQEVINGAGGNFVPYTGATANVDLGEFELKAGQLTLDVSPTGTAAVGTTRWNNTLGSSETTLKGGSVILKNGVDLVARVVNKVTPNATLTKANYTAVRVSGAQGQRLAVAYAQANNDNNSADTIGLVTETIPTNQEGFIITVGQIEDVNTTGSLQGETWADGDVLYLSSTIPGAVTNIKPTAATAHIVVIGYVEYAHVNYGKIYVKIMNGWELDELHNVYINTGTLANNDALIYESSTQLWKNKPVTETILSLSDVTTNDVSITKHGFVPKAPNDTTKYLRGDGTWATAAGGGITIGTTAVTSGTDGRVFFQAGGVVQQDANFTYDNTLKRLGLKAVGTAATDIPFNVQNSAGTLNFLEIRGDNQFLFTNNSNGVTLPFTIKSTDNNSAPYIRAISNGDISEASLIATRTGGSGVAPTAINRGFVQLANSGGNLNVLSSNGGFAFSIQPVSGYNPTSDQMRLLNGNLSIGTGYTGTARLDVRAQGALSTDIAFRVRNSANSANLYYQDGTGTFIFRNNAGNKFIYWDGSNTLQLGTSGGQTLNINTESTAVTRITTTSDLLYSGVSTHVFLQYKNGNFQLEQTSGIAQTSGEGGLSLKNGTAPTVSSADRFIQYSADITAGNAAPHFRTENGAIVKVYQETTAVVAATLVGGGGTTITDTDTFGGYTLQQIAQALKNLGILA
jgi:hypothetical protein